VALALLLGCGSSDKKDDDESGGTGGTAAGSGGSSGSSGKGGSSGASGSAGSAGRGGSSGAGTGGSENAGAGGSDAAGSAGSAGTSGPIGPNMPDVTFEGTGGEIVTGESGTDVIGEGPEWLRVTSSHYYVHSAPGDALYEARWLASVENIGNAPVCSIIIHPTFYGADGESLLDLLPGTVYAPLYRRPEESGPRACIAPGERGIALALDSMESELDVSDVAEVRYTVSGATYDDLELSDWVSLGDVSNEGSVIGGSLINGEAELGWWHVFVFAEGEGGVPLESQDFSDNLTGIEPGYIWNFHTEPFSVPFTEFEVFFDHNVR